MIGIYVICLFIFPLLVFFPIKLRRESKTVLLDKKDSYIIRGIAMCFVVLAHLVDILSEGGMRLAPALKLFTPFGGMGVLLFFFLSGYGIYKSYAEKKPSLDFVKRRIGKLIIPYIELKIIFILVELIINKTTNFCSAEFIFKEWFVYVIIIQYTLFFLTWKCIVALNATKKHLVSAVTLLNLFVILIFMYMQLPSRWYNGLLLFPFGMFIAAEEKQLFQLIARHTIFKMATCLLMFGNFGVLYFFNKDTIWGQGCKVIAGVMLCLVFCLFFYKIQLQSNIMLYIGRKSIYIYILHLEIISAIGKQGLTSETELIFAFYVVLLFSCVSVILFDCISSAFR